MDNFLKESENATKPGTDISILSLNTAAREKKSYKSNTILNKKG